jgi:hypothetical protein
VPDPDRVEDVVEGLVPSHNFDATFLSEVDAEAILRNRLKMKVILSRHGRIDFHSWEHRDVREMAETFEELMEVIKVEGAAREDAAA